MQRLYRVGCTVVRLEQKGMSFHICSQGAETDCESLPARTIWAQALSPNEGSFNTLSNTTFPQCTCVRGPTDRKTDRHLRLVAIGNTLSVFKSVNPRWPLKTIADGEIWHRTSHATYGHKRDDRHSANASRFRVARVQVQSGANYHGLAM